MRKIFCLYILIITSLAPVKVYGQGVRFSEPERLDKNINSQYEEVMALPSADGKTLYFSRFYDPRNMGGRQSGADIYMSRQDAGRWMTATNNLTRINNNYNNAIVGISRDERKLFLINNYGGRAKNRSGVAESIGILSRWSIPVDMEIPGTESQTFHGYYMHPDGKILVISMDGPESQGEEDLYVSLKNENGEWSEPLHMGSTINSNRFDISPFLSEDGKRLFFASARPGGYGDSDLYVSERLYGTWNVWSQPVNLGRTVNSEYFDAYPGLSTDGTLYFSSNRGGELSDIYKTKLQNGTYEQLASSGAVTSGGESFAVGVDSELSDDELEGIFGMSIPSYLEYDRNKRAITAGSRELIWFVANELESHPEVGVIIYANERDQEEAEAMREYFISSGLVPERIAVKRQGEGKESEISNGVKSIEFAFLK
ncbi:hypothetical protein AB9P05_15285 [Roseivirga sp. BDSF3-8]|uniref:hypothetical protein n=1 Tax=Roseivirga sp. BDSF3-8 TaxID=3241598 RepID=UPI00353242B8